MFSESVFEFSPCHNNIVVFLNTDCFFINYTSATFVVERALLLLSADDAPTDAPTVAPTVAPTEPPTMYECESEWTEIEGKCYKLYEQKISITEALAACEADGAVLAMPKTSAVVQGLAAIM